MILFSCVRWKKLGKGTGHQGHRDRLRARFEREGAASLEPHVLLELILFYSVPRADTNPIAHRLLGQFGSIANVFEAPYEELLKVKGIGPASATLLRMIPGLTSQYLISKNDTGVILDSSKKLGEFLLPRFIGLNNEVLMLACLDHKCKLLYCTIIAEGSLDSVKVDIRKIVEAAMRVSAAGIVIAHNHTHGFCLPSYADKSITLELKKVLKPISIELIDHIIVSGNEYISMANAGYLTTL